MVDPARVVAADLRIDYFAAFEAEIECVWIVLDVGSTLPGDALAGVFDNAGALADELRGVNAATVHAGLANIESSGWLSSFGFLRHNRSSNEHLKTEGRIRKEESEEKTERNQKCVIRSRPAFGPRTD